MSGFTPDDTDFVTTQVDRLKAEGSPSPFFALPSPLSPLGSEFAEPLTSPDITRFKIKNLPNLGGPFPGLNGKRATIDSRNLQICGFFEPVFLADCPG